MSKPNHNARRLWLVLALLSALSMWHYEAHVWSAGQPANFSDLYASWWGTHELLLHHRDPYNVEVSHEIQRVIYGAPVSVSKTGDPEGRSGGFAYPIYVVFILWPTVWLSFALTQTMFTYLLIGFVLLALVLWLYAGDWHLEPWQFLIVAVFALGSFPSLQGIKLQNPSVLVAFLVAAAMASLAAGYLSVAGVLLALATIKPHLVGLLILWLALWTTHDWVHRRRLAQSFLATMALLLMGSEWLAPGWIGRFVHVAHAYTQYTYGHSLLDVWFTPSIGHFIAAGLVTMVLALCWQCRSNPARTPVFFLVASLLLATTLVVVPTLEPHAQLLLLPGFLFLLQYRDHNWRWERTARLLVGAPWILLAWGWVAAVGMTLATLWVPASTLRRYWILPLATSPLLPFAILLALGLLLVTERSTRGS